MKKQIRLLNPVVTMMMGVLISTTSWCQSQTDSLAMDDDQFLASIARYPTDFRTAILDVAQYPKVLVKLEQVQARSSQSFQDLVEPFPRNEQEQLYQASRFPETVSQLVIAGKGHPDRIRTYIKDLPDELQQQLFDAYNKHYDELVRMDRIYGTSQGKLQTLTDSYPESVQNSFRKVLSNPDIMTLLTDNINLTVNLGEAFKSDPQGITQQLDQMNYQLTEQNGKDLLAYKEEVAKDPALQDEMKNAADDYAQQNNRPYGNPNVVNNYYTSAPYPYWFGYPSWYGSPMWYPNAYYYTGYYFGAGGIVITGMPSMGYSRWFYSRGYNRYPRMYHCYNTYYNMPTRNIVNAYRGMYNRGSNYGRRSNSYYYGNSSRGNAQRRNSYTGSSYGNRSRSYSQGNISSGGDRRRNSGLQPSSSSLQQGSSYNQPYQRYHASTYNPALRSTGYGGRGFSSSGSRGFSSGGGRGYGGSGFSGGSRGFNSGGGQNFSGGGQRSSGGGGSHGRGR